MDGFPKRFRRLREAQGLTHYRLAQRTGLTQQGLINLEQPDADPKLSTLLRLAQALGVNPAALVPGADGPPPLTSSPVDDGDGAPARTARPAGPKASSSTSVDYRRTATRMALDLLDEIQWELQKGPVGRSIAGMMDAADCVRLLLEGKPVPKRPSGWQPPSSSRVDCDRATARTALAAVRDIQKELRRTTAGMSVPFLTERVERVRRLVAGEPATGWK